MGLVTATVKEANRVEMEVSVDAAAFEDAVGKAYRKNIKRMNVPGFRKGKAPRSLVEKLYGENCFYEEAVNDLYPAALDAAIKESGYEYVEDKVDLDVISVGKEGLVFKAVVTVKPEVEVGTYKGLEAAKTVAEVTDEDVEKELAAMQERNARLVTVEDRPSQEGDTVVFDFDGYLDGEPFPGGKAEHYSLEIGSGRFIPGFEPQLTERTPGDEFEVTTTFPEDYHESSVAGKDVVFQCKLYEVKRKELPELNDEFAKDISEFDTLEEYKEDFRKKESDRREKQAQNDFDRELTGKLAEAVSGDIPEAMFRNQAEQSVREMERRLQGQGMNMEMYKQYTGLDDDTILGNFMEQAKKTVKVRLALEKIVKLENITVSDADVEAEYTSLTEQYGLPLEKVKSFIAAEDLRKDIEVERAMELVKAAAKA